MAYDLKDNPIVRTSFAFAVDIVNFTDDLMQQRRYVIAQQLLRSGTSVAANVREAQHAESRSDFIHKMKIAAKEAEESAFWLSLCEAAERYPNPGRLTFQLDEVQRLLNKIIYTSKLNQEKENQK